MRTETVIVAAFFVPLIVKIVLSFLESSKEQSGKTVCAPKIIKLGGLFGSIASLLLAAISLFLDENRNNILAVACGIGVLSCLFLLIEYSLKINYDKNSFTVKRIFRKELRCRYGDIESVTLGNGGGYKLVVNGKKIRVDSIMTGKLEFFEYAERKYSAIHACSIPMELERLFNGYILNPWEFLVTAMLVPIIVTASTIVIAARGVNLSPQDELYHTEICIYAYYEDGKNLTLLTDEGKMLATKSSIDLDRLNDAISTSKTFSIDYEPWKTPAKGERFTYIRNLADENGQVYITYEEELQAETKAHYIFTVSAFTLSLLLWGAFFFNCYIMSHAPDHPILMRILVKRSYWNF